jgi:predicted nucleotidyltransferase component of viral defense system
MIRPDFLKNYFPSSLWENRSMHKFMVREYLQLSILDYLTTTSFIRKIIFIGGSNLRLTKGIDRFSEDLDFDCKEFKENEFIQMTDDIIKWLQRTGFHTEVKDKSSDKLKAFRRNLYFPELLFDLGLSAYRQERFLIKIESQDQQLAYNHKMTNVQGCGHYFLFPVPSDAVLCAMKISALLSQQKGRDFYDVMFLLGQTLPDFDFLSARCGINNLPELKEALTEVVSKTDMAYKARDFEHLVFEQRNARRILSFGDFVKGLNG